MIDLCLCLHDPEPAIIRRVLKAIALQTAARESFRVLIIDNANEPPLSLNDAPYALLRRAGCKTRLIREPKLGVARARVRALRESKAPAILFVDEDNILHPGFVENALAVLAKNPSVGCFSGKIRLAAKSGIPRWVRPLSASLAARDLGPKPVTGWFRGTWAPWVPACAASLVLRREVATAFLRNHASRPDFYFFGRKGRSGLLSGEDFLITLSAADAGYQCGYFPQLKMTHFLRHDRFSPIYIAKLMASFARTDLQRELHYLKLPPMPFSRSDFRYRMLALDLKGEDPRAIFCYWIYQFVYVRGRVLALLAQNTPIFG